MNILIVSIMNSLVIVLFLSGFVAKFMLRILHKDIARYNQLKTSVSCIYMLWFCLRALSFAQQDLDREDSKEKYHVPRTISQSTNTLALLSYFRGLEVKAVQEHRAGIGSIPAGEITVYLMIFFSTVLGLNFDVCMMSTRKWGTFTL